MRNIPNSTLMKKQTFKTTNKNTTNYQKIAEKYRTKIPKIRKTCIVATLHKYEFTQVLKTHTHSYTHQSSKVCSIFVGIYHIERQNCASQICLTDLSLFLDNLSTLRRALSLSFWPYLAPVSLILIEQCQKRVYLCLNPAQSHTESKGNQHMLTFCVVIDIYLHR